MKHQSTANMRGAVDIPLVVVLGAGTSILLGFVGFVISTTSNLTEKIDSNRDVVFENTTRISVVETEVKRIPYLEAKVDKLLERQGIDPNKVLPAAVISAFDVDEVKPNAVQQ